MIFGGVVGFVTFLIEVINYLRGAGDDDDYDAPTQHSNCFSGLKI